MATIATIRADLIGSSAVFRSEMIAGARQANQSLVQVRSDVRQTAESIVAMNRAAAGFVGFQAVKRGVGDLVDAQLKMQSIHYTLLAATGSAQLAGQAFEFVQERAHTLGLDLQPTAEGFAKLSASASALGVSMADQMALFDAYAKASTTLHLSSEKSNSALMALEQMMGKGKIQAQELRLQLGQAIPGAAARFQNAVMEMVKGTDLAGKSFDQLLQAGELTTTRFLPALVQALQESGRGWEEASHGLNAELNRLRTNWFQMKADVSGGLFDDAATASVRLMADNLQNLANVAGVTGGLVVSRLAGIGLGKVYDAGASAVEAQRQARVTAEVQADLAKSALDVAEAQFKATEAALAGTTEARKQAFEQRGLAQALHQRALTENEAAQATLAHQQGAMTLSANIRAQRDATENARVAQINLARAQRQYDTAVASGNVLKREQIALEARLIEAKAASATATEAQIAAERQLAATTTGGLLARGAKSFGGFALGLVGGPWGAAIATIGAVGYAIYDLNKASERWRQETQEQVKSLQDLREQVREAAKDYGTLHAAMNLSQAIDLYGQSSDELQKKRDELADMQAQADRLQATINARASGPNPYGGGNGAADFFDQRKLSQLNDRISDLRAELEPTEGAVSALSDATRVRLTPSVEGLKAAIDALKAGGGVKGFLAALPTPEEISAYVKRIDEASRNVESGLSAIASAGASYAKKAATDGKTASQVLQYDLDQVVKNIKAQHLVAAEEAKAIAAAQKEAAPHLQQAAAYDAAEAAKKSVREATTAARQQKEAYDSVVRSITERIAQDKEAAVSDDKLTAAERLRVQVQNDIASGHLKLIKGERGYIDQLLKEAVAQGEAAKAAIEHKKQAEAMAIAQENLARIGQQLDQQRTDALAGIGHGQKYAQDAAGVRDIQRQYDDLMARAGRDLTKGTITRDTYDQMVRDYRSALDQQLRDQEDFYRQRDAMQADWRNGAIAAMEDWRDAAANNASQVADLMTNAANNMTDAFVQFALTGKLSFKDFANSVIADLARIAYRKAIAGIFEYAVGAYFGYGSGAPATGGSTTPAGDGFTYNLPFGGGKATGGATAGGTLYEVAEGGRPELYQSGGRTYLLSSQDGHVTPARAGSGAVAGDVEVVINITNNGQAVQAQQAGQRMDGKKVIIDMVLQAVQSDIAKGGGTAQAMQQRFGLQRRGVPVGG